MFLKHHHHQHHYRHHHHQQQHLLVIVAFLLSANGPGDVNATITAPPAFFKEFESHTGGATHFVMVGSSITIPCIPPEVNKLKLEEPKYSWSNSTDYKDLDLKYYSGWRVDDTSPEITMNDVSLRDVGKYYCTARSRVHKKIEPTIYEHNLAVYQLPFYTMKWMVYHATKSCEKEARFNKYSVEITKALCLGLADCNWSIKYESCVAAGADMSKAKWDLMKTWVQGDEGKLIVEFKMVLKMNKNYRPPDCDLTCITKNVKINLEEEYKPKLETFKSLSRDAFRDSLDLVFMEGMMKQEISLICPEGYEQYKTEVCVPCFPGSAKKDTSDDKCSPCGHFSYQDRFAAKECTGCPSMQLTGIRGADNSDLCTLYFKSVMFWVVAILVIVVAAGPIAVMFFCCKKMKGKEGTAFKCCDKCCGFGRIIKPPDEKYEVHKKESAPDLRNAFPALYELPKEKKKKRKKAFGEEWIGSPKKKKKGKAGGKKKGKKSKKGKKGKKGKKSKKGPAPHAHAIGPGYGGFAPPPPPQHYNPYAARYPYQGPGPAFPPGPAPPPTMDPLLLMLMMDPDLLADDEDDAEDEPDDYGEP